MTISSDDVAKLDALLGGADAERSAVMALRQQLPHLSLTSCDPSDIDAEAPFRDYPRFSAYLVDGSQRCWTITDDVTKATGLVVTHHKVARN